MATHSSQKRYPPELRERAVRMVFKTIEDNGGERFGVITRVARQLGVGTESLRTWVRQAEVDQGRRDGVTTEERRRMTQLERENRELRRANEILKAAAAFFGAELDRRPSKEWPSSTGTVRGGGSSRSAGSCSSPPPRTTRPSAGRHRPGPVGTRC